MKLRFTAALILTGLGLVSCNKSPAENLADRVETAADNRADALENRADALDDRAEQIRRSGNERADAISAADRNVTATMTQDRRDAIVANEAPAVR